MKIVSRILLGLVLVLFATCKTNEPVNNNEPVDQGRAAKRGVSFTFELVDDVTLLGPGISWSYNWGSSQPAIFDNVVKQHNIDFFPMAWNGVDAAKLREYKQRHPECKYILAFNEPNLNDQAKMTPSQAAAKWPELKAIAAELNLKIVSPAMNYGTLSGYSDPIKWLDEFFQLVPISDIDAIAIHCYMSYASATKSYIERFKKYQKPIWMTEFCAWDAGVGTITPHFQMKYMCDIVNYMECDPDIERYAWFIPRSGKTTDVSKENQFPYMNLLSKTTPVELTELGKVYINMSTMDKSIYYAQGQVIQAEHYSNICISECVNEKGWIDGPSLQPTTDQTGGVLDLYNFSRFQWVEYQVNVSGSGQIPFTIRYAASANVELDLYVDGSDVPIELSLPKTGGEATWATETTGVNLSKGKHTLRLRVLKGTLNVNWLKFG